MTGTSPWAVARREIPAGHTGLMFEDASVSSTNGTSFRTISRFFGSYANGCRLADELLFKAGDADAVDEACRRSAVGKVLPNALYVHRTGSMRWTRCCGCSRAVRTYLGEIAGANLIKLHRQSGKVSYLAYPEFETDPHPVCCGASSSRSGPARSTAFNTGTVPTRRSCTARSAFCCPSTRCTAGSPG